MRELIEQGNEDFLSQLRTPDKTGMNSERVMKIMAEWQCCKVPVPVL